LTDKREDQQKLTEQVRARARLTSPEPGKSPGKAPTQQPVQGAEVSAAERVRRAREQSKRDRDRGLER
jgi:hypothetical protein